MKYSIIILQKSQKIYFIKVQIVNMLGFKGYRLYLLLLNSPILRQKLCSNKTLFIKAIDF